jgi:hypothetical protein
MEIWNCIGCDKQYVEKSTDRYSNYMEDYVRYVGHCGIKCWDKKDLLDRNRIMATAYFYDPRELKEKYKKKRKNFSKTDLIDSIKSNFVPQ